MLNGVKLHREPELNIFFDPWQVRNVNWAKSS
jgi:hypothetical protein